MFSYSYFIVFFFFLQIIPEKIFHPVGAIPMEPCSTYLFLLLLMCFSTLKNNLCFLEKTYITLEIWGLQKKTFAYLNSMDHFTLLLTNNTG